MFANRKVAGRELANRLDQFFSSHPELNRSNILVVGLPRGGVPVALEVARKFGCSLEIIMSKKLPFPGRPEYAIGAVSSDGVVFLNPDIPEDSQWKSYIEQQRRQLLQSTTTIENQFYSLSGLKKASLKDKTVIIVDDGIATGMTAVAAIETARRRGAKHVIMAAPVMSSESYEELSSRCYVVTTTIPAEFRAVGMHYVTFDPTSNEEVVTAMRESVKFGSPSAAHRQAFPFKPPLI